MKKLLATLMALAMTLTLCTVAFAADPQENVAKVGDDEYATFEAAVAAVSDNGTITLLNDCSSGRVNLEDKSFTVVLDGHTLTSTAENRVMFCAKNGNKITIDGTKKDSKLVGTLMVTAYTYGSIEMNGGTYESDTYCPIYINGAVSNDNSQLTVKDAVINAIGTNAAQDRGCAVYLAGYSTSAFTNCTITAPITGIEIRAGVLTLNGCSVTGGSGEVVVESNGNGTTVKNAALAIAQHDTKKNISVTIIGGEYNATAAVYQTNPQKNSAEDQKNVSTIINSGVFNGEVSRTADAGDSSVTVSGGTFSKSVNRTFLADNLKYEVRTKDGKVAYYSDYDSAVAAAEAAETTNEILRVDKTENSNDRGVRFTIVYADGSGKKVALRMTASNFELPTLERTGYTFKGWKVTGPENDSLEAFSAPYYSSEQIANEIFAGAAGDGELDSDQYRDYSDGVTLTAVWEKNSSNRYYYTSTTTDTKKDDTKGSPKTFDPGVGIYALTAVLSVTGMACVGKKKF